MLVFGSHRENLASRRVAVEPPQPLASLIIAPTPPPVLGKDDHRVVLYHPVVVFPSKLSLIKTPRYIEQLREIEK